MIFLYEFVLFWNFNCGNVLRSGNKVDFPRGYLFSLLWDIWGPTTLEACENKFSAHYYGLKLMICVKADLGLWNTQRISSVLSYSVPRSRTSNSPCMLLGDCSISNLALHWICSALKFQFYGGGVFESSLLGCPGLCYEDWSSSSSSLATDLKFCVMLCSFISA